MKFFIFFTKVNGSVITLLNQNGGEIHIDNKEWIGHAYAVNR